eukprot:571110-Hanusia_phi.AAC.1
MKDSDRSRRDGPLFPYVRGCLRLFGSMHLYYPMVHGPYPYLCRINYVRMPVGDDARAYGDIS